MQIYLVQLSEDQILSLAPDEASKKSGKDLANPAKWVSKGINAVALWGECQGSGSKPYQTQVDLTNIAFKCSCPSRKFPCKHGLGLLLLHARQKQTFTDAQAPAWVTEWLDKRVAKEEKKALAEDKPVDEAAQAKRLQARQQKVGDGIEELRLWLKDLVRNGLLNLPGKGSQWYENMARRLVDAQAPGLAGMVRNAGAINLYAEGWQSQLMDQLLHIYLVAEGYRNIDGLPTLLQQDIRTLVGFTNSQEALKEQPGCTDTWLVLCKQVTNADNITNELYWLYGTATNQYAVVLQFVARGQIAALALMPGTCIHAELVYYPSVRPLRALIKNQHTVAQVPITAAYSGWQQVAAAETDACSQLPFATERPFIVQALKPVQYNNEWWLQDAELHIARLKNSGQRIWPLLSLSGGAALHTAVTGREGAYEPVGVWLHDEYKVL
jgi:hypothetical protein